MKEEKEFREMRLRVALLPPIFGCLLFIILTRFEIQITQALAFTFLSVLFIWLYWSRTHTTVRLGQTHLSLENKLEKKEIAFQDIEAMSFGGVFFGANRYHLRLKNGKLVSIPLMDAYSEFEKDMEKRANLILAGESIVNSIEFRIMTPKNRRWTKNGLPYQKTNDLDVLNPGYLDLEKALPLLFFVSFVIAMLVLLSESLLA